MRKAVERSKRGNVAYEPGFLRTLSQSPDSAADAPPFARLIQGGRGGEVRLKLYLMLTMMATQQPFDIRNPPTPMTLARALDLPPRTGPRRINDNLKWLTDNHFIARTKRPGQPAAIQLLDPVSRPSNDRGPMLSPRRASPYLTMPITFWSQGWLLDLSPRGIAVLFALAEHAGGRSGPAYLTRFRRDSYGLSHDTWTRGTRELRDCGLLTVRRTPQGDDFDYRRMRNTYQLDLEKLRQPSSS
jgi:hypothetical protein